MSSNASAEAFKTRQACCWTSCLSTMTTLLHLLATFWRTRTICLVVCSCDSSRRPGEDSIIKNRWSDVRHQLDRGGTTPSLCFSLSVVDVSNSL